MAPDKSYERTVKEAEPYGFTYQVTKVIANMWCKDNFWIERCGYLINVHQTYEMCSSFHTYVYIWPIRCVRISIHIYVSSDLQKLCIRPTNSVHPTYKRSAFNLQLSEQPTCSRSDTLTIFFNWVCIWHKVHLINSS